MTDVTLTIGGIAYSNYVLDVDVQKNKVTGIGTCEIRLNNPNDILGATFSTNDSIAITINGAVPSIFAGKVKDVIPYLTDEGVYTNELTITGVDYGRYGADYHFTEKYELQPGGAIIDKILANLVDPDPWDYIDPGGTPNVKYEGKKTYLGDAVREICDEMGYDSYVDHATPPMLHIFQAGTVNSGVKLISLSGDNTSNLLSFREFEQEGGDLRNDIEVSAGNVKDHYTEENAGDWTGGGGGVVTDEVDDGVGIDQVIYGKGSIKLTCTGAISRAYLDFSAGLVLANYGYSGSVNLLPFCQAKVLVKGERTGEDRFHFRPYLIDTGGKKIVFSRRKSSAGSKGLTEDIPDFNIGTGQWSVITYPLGAHDGNPVKVAGSETTGFWTFAAGSIAPFDWEHVEIMGFEYPDVENAVIYIDGWTIPSLEAKYTVNSLASRTAYDRRMEHEYRRELRSMTQLKAYGDRLLETKKDPLVKFKAVARGQMGTIYAAQIVKVRAPQHGIFAESPYIIVRLQHILRKKSDIRGFDFWTTYDLVESDTDAWRVIRSTDPNAVMLAKLRRENRGFKGALDDWDFFVGDAETGTRIGFTMGIAFPTDPADEDIHQLTIDIAGYYGAEGVWYRWNETTSDWERGPITMHRNVTPAAADAVDGDTLHRTDTGVWYRMIGGAWIIIVISGSSLKKGMQPFDSAILFEPIRAAATDAAPFVVDINDVTDPGRARITGLNAFGDFTAGDNLIIQNAEDENHNTTARSVHSVDPAGHWIKLDNVLGGADNAHDEQIAVSAMDAVKWTGATPAIWYADGGTEDINTGSAQGIFAGPNWIYFTVGGVALAVTNNYPTAVGDTVGIVCRLEIRADSEPLIMPVYSRGGNATLDFLGAGAVDTLVLTGEEIYGKHFSTAYNVGPGQSGVTFNRGGILGYGGGALQFQIRAADGMALFAGGAGIISSSGIQITTAGAADYLRFYKGLGVEIGSIGTGGGAGHLFLRGNQEGNIYVADALVASYLKIDDSGGADDGEVTIASSGGENITLVPSNIVESTGDVSPLLDHTRGLGAPAKTWRYYNPVTSIAFRPAAAAGVDGLQWCTTEGGATDGIMWVCMRNDAGGYEWVELGRTA